MKNANSYLLKALFEKHGGISLIARYLGIQRQNLDQWRLRGWVPTKYWKALAEKWGIPMAALGFIKADEIYTGSHRSRKNEWINVVMQCSLPVGIHNKICSMPDPK